MNNRLLHYVRNDGKGYCSDDQKSIILCRLALADGPDHQNIIIFH